MLDLKKIKYLCSDKMKPYLNKISIDDRTKQFCDEYVSWLVKPRFWEVNDLILLEFPNKDIKIINWDRRIGNKGSLTFTEWDSNHIDSLNDYLPEIDSQMLRNVAFYIYSILKISLKEQFPNYLFQVVMSFDVEFDLYHLYFYRCRDNELLMVRDVSEFMDPILAEII